VVISSRRAPKGSQDGGWRASRESMACTPAPGLAGMNPRREEITTWNLASRAGLSSA
jgi:hypothetical protein